MRRIQSGLAGLAGLAVVLALVPPAAATQKTPAAIKAAITSQITTNGTRAITGAILNTILTDIADSYGDISCTQFPILSGAVTSPGTTCVTTLGAAVQAQAGTLTGATLASNVTASSLISFGSAPTLASPTFTGTAAGANVIGLAILAQGAANTLVGNSTGSTTNHVDVAVPACATSASVLQWSAGAGFGCNVGIVAPAGSLSGTVATSAIPAFTGDVTNSVGSLATTVGKIQTVTVGSPTGTAGSAVVLATSPTITTPNVVGVSNAGNATAGSLGEYTTQTVLVGAAVALTTNTDADVTSVSLTAGDWQCTGNIAYTGTGTTSTTVEQGWISLTGATLPTIPNSGAYTAIRTAAFVGASGLGALSVSALRVNVASTTSVFLSTRAAFTVSTLAGYGFLGCLRIR